MGKKLQLSFYFFSFTCLTIFTVKLRLNPNGAVYKNGFSICVGNEKKKKLLRILWCHCANPHTLKLKPARKNNIKTCKSTCTHSNGADAHQTKACKTAEEGYVVSAPRSLPFTDMEIRCNQDKPSWNDAAEAGQSQLATN